MKVLARRANGILIFGPIFLVLCIALWVFVGISTNNSDKEILNALYLRVLILSWLTFPIVLWYFVQRLFIPKVIIECDDFGIYIYLRKKETIVLRYEYLDSLYAEADVEDTVIYVGRRPLFSSDRRRIEIGGLLEKFIKTGNLRIRTGEDAIELKGIYHVKSVKEDLDRLIRKNRKTHEKNVELLQYASRDAIEDYLKDKNYL